MPPTGGGVDTGSRGTTANGKKGGRNVVFAPSPIPWVSKPEVPAGEPIPSGLEYLLRYDEVIFIPLEDKQGFEEIDKLTLKNTYDIRTKDGKRLYLAVFSERPGLVFRRQWAFRLSFYDRDKRRVFIFNRASTLHCFSCIETCRTQVMRGKVGKPIGEVGSIVCKCHWLRKPSFSVIDAANNSLYRLKPPTKANKGLFHVLDKKTKKQEGTMGVVDPKPPWTNEQHAFRVEFPKDSPCHVKVLLMAAGVLLNVLYWDTEDRGPPPEISPAEFEELTADLLDEDIAQLDNVIASRDGDHQQEKPSQKGHSSQPHVQHQLSRQKGHHRGSYTRLWDRVIPKLSMGNNLGYSSTSTAVTSTHPRAFRANTTFVRTSSGTDVMASLISGTADVHRQDDAGFQHSNTSLPCLKGSKSKLTGVNDEEDEGFVKVV